MAKKKHSDGMIETSGSVDAWSVASAVSTVIFLGPAGLAMLAMMARDFEGGEQSMLLGMVFMATAPVTTVCGVVACMRLGVRRARLARWSLAVFWLPLAALVLFAFGRGSGG
jgi:hypothetical protein